METLWWTISLGLMAAGMVGAVFPVLPDSLLILAGAVLHYFTVHSAHSIGPWTLAAIAVLCIVAHIVDFTAGAIGAKKYGASKWGAFGGMVGGIVGTIFFFPVGLFAGPVIGALAAEIILAGRALGPAAKSSWGTLLGTTAGMLAKIIIDVAMVVVFFASAFLHR